ncbi:sulfotransferase domain-containing protein [Desmospora profundinema]|uniref:Sulfotransferase domain-containing protein n=1 Tax=Desmospora profundinema TaxID=1571184 RepID=A0ABU1IKH2_9BACL|nr:sulfotransferase domain-containing protein [Desmospora profundinema]MDR6225282.1 hypothetical protein [Desmospora profundinema]
MSLPDFIIVGGQKCGTTSLYNYLINQRYIVPAKTKEVHYFDVRFSQGLSWYKDKFPLSDRRKKRGFITGEASPYYLFHPYAAKRAADTVPKAKIIVLLRNPVDRAYSHYHHQVRRGKESLSFEKAIRNERARTHMEQRRMLRNKNYNSSKHRLYSYMARGIYLNQLKRWRKHFPKQQIMIIQSEDFYKNTNAVLKRVTRFLGVPYKALKTTKPYKSASYEPMHPKTRRMLVHYFRPHNRQLYRYLGTDFGWDW